MKIRTRLRLNAWISLGVILLMVFSFVWSFREIYRHDQNAKLAAEMQKSVFERDLRDRGIFLIIFLVLSGGIAIIANSIVTSRIVAKRMAAINKGIGIIGDGDLDYRIDMEGNDEFSELARSSNEMAVRLNEFHTSVECLKKEIAERKQAEEDLRISEMRFRAIMDQAVDMIFVHDIKGRFVDANQEACKNLGYTKEELLRMSVADIDTEAIADGGDAFWDTVVEGQRFTFESRHKRKDGDSYPVEISIGPIVLGGETLIIASVRNIIERKRTEEELRTSHQQLQALAARLQQAHEESRVMTSREIHDELGGGLTGLKMELAWLLRKAYDVKAGKARTDLMDKIHTSTKLIDQVIQVSHRIATNLRPSVLDDLDLIAALKWQLDEFKSRTKIPFEFATDLDCITLEPDTVTAVFRIFQEALTNVARHSRATKVTVLLREDDGSLFLEIRDNGRGITEGEILGTKSLGILGMRERALVFGGELRISGGPDSGTALILKIPQKQGETP